MNIEFNCCQKFVMLIWKIFWKRKIKMYEYCLKQGFTKKSCYHITKYANKDLVKFITNRI